MESEVYADLLFLVNFSMDFFCLYLTARALHRPLSAWRAALASALGGVYAVAVLFLPGGRGFALALDLVSGYLLCMIALGDRREGRRSRVRTGALFLLISFLLGGVMTVLYDRLNRVPGLLDGVAAEGTSTLFFLALAVVATLLTTLWGRACRRAVNGRRVTVVIKSGGTATELCGLVDTGNLLTEPISGCPVIPVSLERLGKTAPREILRTARSGNITEALAGLPPERMRGVRVIPARTALEHGERMLLGWQPDEIRIRAQHGEHEIEAFVTPVNLGRGDGIEAIVPSVLI